MQFHPIAAELRAYFGTVRPVLIRLYFSFDFCMLGLIWRDVGVMDQFGNVIEDALAWSVTMYLGIIAVQVSRRR